MWATLLQLLLKLLPLILSLLGNIGPNTLKRYATELGQLRSASEQLANALAGKGVSPVALPTFAAAPEDISQ